jgi:N-methylhydantoinase B
MDQLVLDVLWNRLISVVNEQAAALMRTSFTSIVREAGDLSAGVFDRRGRMIAQAVTGTPGHINSMATSMRHFLARYPVNSLRPGDVLITNDPWKTASQLNDITIVTPIFSADGLVAFLGNTCHALDIGGRGLSADSHEVFEEGLFIPVMKLYEAGDPVTAVFDLIQANVRAPEEVLGDIHSQVVGNAVGGRQLLSFMQEFGLDHIEELADSIVERSEAVMRQRIAALPNGRYPYQLTIDGFDAPVTIQVTVTISDDQLQVDYAGTSPRVAQGINVTLNYTTAYTTYGIKCAISPDVPNNDGSFRPVTVTAPVDCILNAQFPAAVGGRHLVGHFLPAAVFGALASALPERVMAPGADGLWDTQVFGEDPHTGGRFTYVWFSAGGTGALATKDGLSATAFPSGIAGVPAEVIEQLSPLLVKRRALRQDSGGAGTYRGGLGQVMELAVRGDKPFIFSGLYERIQHPAPGLHGGRAGAPGRLHTNNPDVTLRAKTRTLLPAGTEITLELPGGGGFGPPWRRARRARRLCLGRTSSAGVWRGDRCRAFDHRRRGDCSPARHHADGGGGRSRGLAAALQVIGSPRRPESALQPSVLDNRHRPHPGAAGPLDVDGKGGHFEAERAGDLIQVGQPFHMTVLDFTPQIVGLPKLLLVPRFQLCDHDVMRPVPPPGIDADHFDPLLEDPPGGVCRHSRMHAFVARFGIMFGDVRADEHNIKGF